MTNGELFKKIFGTAGSPIGCAHFLCNGETNCPACKAKDFWNKEADLAVIGANLFSEKELSKAILNSMYGKRTYIIGGRNPKHTLEELMSKDIQPLYYKDTDTPIIKVIDNWTEVPASLLADSIHSIGEILDDATVHGLDFKYENGKYYTKERTPNYGFRPLDID